MNKTAFTPVTKTFPGVPQPPALLTQPLRSSRRGFFAIMTIGLASLFKMPRLVRADVETFDFPPGWSTLPRIPVLASTLPEARAILDAIHSNSKVSFTYEGGTSPGLRRKVSPAFLFRLEGYPHLYFTAYCHERHANRTFRLDRCVAIA